MQCMGKIMFSLNPFPSSPPSLFLSVPLPPFCISFAIDLSLLIFLYFSHSRVLSNLPLSFSHFVSCSSATSPPCNKINCFQSKLSYIYNHIHRKLTKQNPNPTLKEDSVHCQNQIFLKQRFEPKTESESNAKST